MGGGTEGEPGGGGVQVVANVLYTGAHGIPIGKGTGEVEVVAHGALVGDFGFLEGEGALVLRDFLDVIDVGGEAPGNGFADGFD